MASTMTETLPCGFYPLNEYNSKDLDVVAKDMADFDNFEVEEQVAVEILMDIRYDENYDDDVLDGLVENTDAQLAALVAGREKRIPEGDAYYAVKQARMGEFVMLGCVYFRPGVDVADLRVDNAAAEANGSRDDRSGSSQTVGNAMVHLDRCEDDTDDLAEEGSDEESDPDNTEEYPGDYEDEMQNAHLENYGGSNVVVSNPNATKVRFDPSSRQRSCSLSTDKLPQMGWAPAAETQVVAGPSRARKTAATTNARGSRAKSDPPAEETIFAGPSKSRKPAGKTTAAASKVELDTVAKDKTFAGPSNKRKRAPRTSCTASKAELDPLAKANTITPPSKKRKSAAKSAPKAAKKTPAPKPVARKANDAPSKCECVVIPSGQDIGSLPCSNASCPLKKSPRKSNKGTEEWGYLETQEDRMKRAAEEAETQVLLQAQERETRSRTRGHVSVASLLNAQ